MRAVQSVWDSCKCPGPGVRFQCMVWGYGFREGYLDNPIPIHGVLGIPTDPVWPGLPGKGMIKTTYGTGSSIMMNIGEKPVISTHGVVTSLAWGMDGRVNYVLEGNINYTGAVIT